MTYDKKAHVIGSILAILPFSTSLKRINSSVITKEEQNTLQDALQVSIYQLIRLTPCYGLDADEVDACCAAFAIELIRFIVSARQEQKPPAQVVWVDGNEWELVFDPGPKADGLRTDEKIRVWRKVGTVFDDNDLPF